MNSVTISKGGPFQKRKPQGNGIWGKRTAGANHKSLYTKTTQPRNSVQHHVVNDPQDPQRKS